MNFLIQRRSSLLSSLVSLRFNFESSILHENPFYIVKRFNHFRFKPSLRNKQASLLNKFSNEIEDTLQKIKNNQKVNVKRNKQKLSQTANTLLNMNAGNYEEIEGSNMSSGSPEQLAIRREGFSQSFLSTRMKIMNTNYSRAIAEIFISDQELSEKIDEFKIAITQVRVSSNHRILHVYWTTSHEDVDPKFIANYLSSRKGRIRELLIETNYTSSVPWVMFVYDLQASNDHEISIRLQKCKQDLLQEELSPSPEILDHNFNMEDVTISDKISFENPFETIPMEEYYQKMLNYNPKDYYGNLRLRMPEQMPLNVFNLEYKSLMNKVLQNLHRTRSQYRLSSYQSNAVGDHLPPIDINKQLSNSPSVEYNTEERIKAIKKFVELNRKRVSKKELKLKRMILEREIDRVDSYEQIREKLEESMAMQYDDYDNYETIKEDDSCRQ